MKEGTGATISQPSCLLPCGSHVLTFPDLLLFRGNPRIWILFRIFCLLNMDQKPHKFEEAPYKPNKICQGAWPMARLGIISSLFLLTYNPFTLHMLLNSRAQRHPRKQMESPLPIHSQGFLLDFPKFSFKAFYATSPNAIADFQGWF